MSNVETLRTTAMTVDEVAKLIDAFTKLIGALAWPLLVAFVLVRFGPALRDFFESLGEFSLKGAGFEASAKRKQAEAAAALAAATAARPEPGATPESTAREAREAADLVSEAVTPRMLRKARRASVLWVDDRPDNNVHERRSLEALGVSFVLARSTDEALNTQASARRRHHFGHGRPPDPRAGYTLLSQLRASGNTTPFVIYAGSNAPSTSPRHEGTVRSDRPIAPQSYRVWLSALRLCGLTPPSSGRPRAASALWPAAHVER